MAQEEYDPADFLKCPNCRRTTTVELVHHLDGDISIDCSACDAHAFGAKLHESDVVHK